MKKKPKIQNSEFKKKRKSSFDIIENLSVYVGVCMCDKISATEMNDNQKKIDNFAIVSIQCLQ